MVDQLADEYASDPVVFIEYDVDDPPYSRYGIWWAAFGGTSAWLPMTMVDSGNQISSGTVSYYSRFKSMVNTALARPPQAEIEAVWWRTGNVVDFYVQVKNLSGNTLSWANSASVQAIVYEDAHVGVTDRFGRGTAVTYIPSLAPNATATFLLETGDLSVGDWNKLHYIVLVDYRPGGSSGPYDMLQAAVAEPVAFPFMVEPDSLIFMIDPADTSAHQRQAAIQGASFIHWTAAPTEPWVTVTPPSGTIPAQPVVSINKAGLSPGWQQASLTFQTDDGSFVHVMSVQVYLGSFQEIYLPAVLK